MCKLRSKAIYPEADGRPGFQRAAPLGGVRGGTSPFPPGRSPAQETRRKSRCGARPERRPPGRSDCYEATRNASFFCKQYGLGWRRYALAASARTGLRAELRSALLSWASPGRSRRGFTSHSTRGLRALLTLRQGLAALDPSLRLAAPLLTAPRFRSSSRPGRGSG